MKFLKKCGLYAIDGGSELLGEFAKTTINAGIAFYTTVSVAFGAAFICAMLGLNMFAFYSLSLPVACYLTHKMVKKLDMDTEIDRDMEKVRNWTREKLREIEEQDSLVLTSEEIAFIRERKTMAERNEEIGADRSAQRENPVVLTASPRLERITIGSTRGREDRVA